MTGVAYANLELNKTHFLSYTHLMSFVIDRILAFPSLVIITSE